MGAAGVKMTGFLEKQGCHERDDQCGAQQIEGVAEGQDKGLLLHDPADGDDGLVRRRRRDRRCRD